MMRPSRCDVGEWINRGIRTRTLGQMDGWMDKWSRFSYLSVAPSLVWRARTLIRDGSLVPISMIGVPSFLFAVREPRHQSTVERNSEHHQGR